MAGIKIIEDIFALLSRLIKMNKTSKNNDNKKIASKKENKKKEKMDFHSSFSKRRSNSITIHSHIGRIQIRKM